MTSVSVTALQKNFGKVQAVKDVSFDVNQGRFLACWVLTGPAKPQPSG